MGAVTEGMDITDYIENDTQEVTKILWVSSPPTF